MLLALFAVHSKKKKKTEKHTPCLSLQNQLKTCDMKSIHSDSTSTHNNEQLGKTFKRTEEFSLWWVNLCEKSKEKKNLFTVWYTSRLSREHFAQSSSDSEIAFFKNDYYLTYQKALPGCDMAAHCTVGNSGQGRQIECIVGIFSKSVYHFFGMLQILLMFTNSLLRTTFWPNHNELLV